MQYDQPINTAETYEGLNFADHALNRVRRVTGKATSPGMSCRDIKERNPDFPSGEYWIDPNERSAVDAILVYCRMETMETCIFPSPSTFDRQRWTKTEGSGQFFMEEMVGDREFFYKTDFSQLKFLQMLSEGARQRVTYHCFNSHARGSRLMLHTGEELDTELYKYKKSTRIATSDECAHDNQWHSAVFDIRTNKTDILPITDIRLFDVGRQNQQFGIELGEVCFG